MNSQSGPQNQLLLRERWFLVCPPDFPMTCIPIPHCRVAVWHRGESTIAIITSVWEDVGKLESSPAGEHVKFSLWKTVWHFLPRKVEHRLTIWPSNASPRYIQKRNKSICLHKNLYMTVYNSPKVEPTQMPINWWMDELCSIHTMEYYSTVKMNGVLIHATVWINLESTVQSKRSQSQKSIHCRMSFIWNILNR